MDMVTFTNRSTGVSTALRPTHARKVLDAVRRAGGTDAAPTATTAQIGTACLEVRSSYRCRTVRKELRRVAVMAEVDGIVDIHGAERLTDETGGSS